MDASEAIDRVRSIPLESIDVSDSTIFRDDTLWPFLSVYAKKLQFTISRERIRPFLVDHEIWRYQIC
ncbi:MAG: hypothetical protein Ct9H300mP8_11510 [Gammaproteobacteria bacterium]|nr:MAG: hypothetical protein Ct9H300mP8_11510 [Gammaproteobacteria bacterium]